MVSCCSYDVNLPKMSTAAEEQLNVSGPLTLPAPPITSSSLEPIITVPDQFSVFCQYDHPPREPDPEEGTVVHVEG